MTLLKVPAGGAFDHLNCQHIGYFDQNFSKRSNVCSLPRGAGGGCLGVGMGSFGIDQHSTQSFKVTSKVHNV